MTIALIAHDSKKELMVQFCTAYCRILSQNQLVATGTTGKLIAEATGLPVKRFLSGKQGGDQQIAARIACNEIDLLIFFRDPINAKPSEPNEMTLLRLCDVHNIPMATNHRHGRGAGPRPGAGRPRLAQHRQSAPGITNNERPKAPDFLSGAFSDCQKVPSICTCRPDGAFSVCMLRRDSGGQRAPVMKALPTTAPSR